MQCFTCPSTVCMSLLSLRVSCAANIKTQMKVRVEQGQYFYLSEGQCLKVNNFTYLKGNCSACLKGKGLFHLDIYRLCVRTK